MSKQKSKLYYETELNNLRYLGKGKGTPEYDVLLREYREYMQRYSSCQSCKQIARRFRFRGKLLCTNCITREKDEMTAKTALLFGEPDTSELGRFKMYVLIEPRDKHWRYI